VKFTLVTGRTIEQGNYIDEKYSHKYKEACAVCFLDKRDMFTLGIPNSTNIKVSTSFGSIVVKAKKSPNRHKGIIFIPMGPWANQLVPPDFDNIGMPAFKGIDAEISITNEKIPDINDILLVNTHDNK
jgi:formylmethanofuran dehydrogenase subunit D